MVYRLFIQLKGFINIVVGCLCEPMRIERSSDFHTTQPPGVTSSTKHTV